MLEALNNQSIKYVRELLMHKSWEEITVGKDILGNGKRKEAVMGMSSTATNIWTLPLMRKNFIAVDEKRFRTYVTDALGSVNDCIPVLEQVLLRIEHRQAFRLEEKDDVSHQVGLCKR